MLPTNNGYHTLCCGTISTLILDVSNFQQRTKDQHLCAEHVFVVVDPPVGSAGLKSSALCLCGCGHSWAQMKPVFFISLLMVIHPSVPSSSRHLSVLQFLGIDKGPACLPSVFERLDPIDYFGVKHFCQHHVQYLLNDLYNLN